MEHEGRHALVTGGGTGIGLSIALALAEAGAEVTITGRDLARLDGVAREHPRLHALRMDVAEEASVRDGIAAAAKARGPIEICVANAGIAEGAPFRRETLEHWRRIMAVNLDGAFVTMQAALATLPPDRPARMIAISSIAGLRGLKNAIAYTASKHGVIGMVRGLSEEYMGGPVTFNAICPGYVDTPIVERNAAEIAVLKGVPNEEARGYLAKGNRHKRLLETDEVTGVAMWLCSDAARSVNGQAIQVAGGQVA
ncbi:SDR family NAD(P)-dependent oxidoreductase [Roseibacterium sp. SDUM158017]|uniref:SDR family NAD(P)-dependent oxidoreductase n=1 Tax=Roseicyclus salinarum TaxID=3036773 RepID=UPI002414FBDB|nr:SDR family oxidoreductase [Roseibacterium sp. SDUM158017]MDG4649934.1 SDR family NAD(P)-dependent oxidoreductase [Roseibacterium sp. SDUM158017]